MVIKVTFDTNCILRNDEDKGKSYYRQIKILEEFNKKGLIKIIKTDVVDTEIGDFPSRLKKSNEFEEKKGIGLWDNSRWDHSVFASEGEIEEFAKLRENQKSSNKKNDIKDIMTLHTHKKYKNHYLLTNNIKDFIFDKDNTNIVNPEKLNVNILDRITLEEELREYFDKIKE